MPLLEEYAAAFEAIPGVDSAEVYDGVFDEDSIARRGGDHGASVYVCCVGSAPAYLRGRRPVAPERFLAVVTVATTSGVETPGQLARLIARRVQATVLSGSFPSALAAAEGVSTRNEFERAAQFDIGMWLVTWTQNQAVDAEHIDAEVGRLTRLRTDMIHSGTVPSPATPLPLDPSPSRVAGEVSEP